MDTKPTDDALLAAFFAEHTDHVEDAGFAARVVAALPRQKPSPMAECVRLQRWSRWLNAAAVAVGVLVVATSDVPGAWRMAVESNILQPLAGFLTSDADTQLVHTMLFLHRAAEAVPPASTLFTWFVVAAGLCTAGIRRLFKYI